MKKNDDRKPDDPAQSRRFEETARKLGVEESGKAFEKALKKLTPSKKPKPKEAES